MYFMFGLNVHAFPPDNRDLLDAWRNCYAIVLIGYFVRRWSGNNLFKHNKLYKKSEIIWYTMVIGTSYGVVILLLSFNNRIVIGFYRCREYIKLLAMLCGYQIFDVGSLNPELTRYIAKNGLNIFTSILVILWQSS